MRDFPFDLSPAMVERFAAWDREPGTPAAARLAATVLLVRDGASGVEVFMQRRVGAMSFAPSRAVFPGGAVDPGDHDPLPWAGPDPSVWAAALRLDPPAAAAVVTAAIRELFEEAGVLLASPSADGARVAGPAWVASARRRILAREATLAGVLTEAGLVARTDLLGYHAHWITPHVEPRRYDTHFFTALLPAGQQADAETTEAESADWVGPRRMLAEAADALMPPTIVCLEDVAAAEAASDLVRVRSDVPVVCPTPVRHGDGWAMRVDLA